MTRCALKKEEALPYVQWKVDGKLETITHLFYIQKSNFLCLGGLLKTMAQVERVLIFLEAMNKSSLPQTYPIKHTPPLVFATFQHCSMIIYAS